MVQNPIYGGSVDIYEELPDGTPLHHIGFNGGSAVAVGMATLPPSFLPPRKTEVEQELSESEREAIEAKLESQDAVSLDTLCACPTCAFAPAHCLPMAFSENSIILDTSCNRPKAQFV